MQFASSAQMKMLRKVIDCESLEVSQENVYDRVSFSKAKSLTSSDCNFTLKRTDDRFILEYVPKASCYKKTILRKKSMVDQRLNKVAAPVVQSPQFYHKTKFI